MELRFFVLSRWSRRQNEQTTERKNNISFLRLFVFVALYKSPKRRNGISKSKIQNSKELLEHLKSPNFNNITSIKSFDFSTLYTTIPHDKLKSRLASIIRNSFMFKNGNRRYKYLVVGHEESYIVKENSDSKHKYSEDDIIKMLEFLVDNIFVVFAGKVFQQIVGIPMGTNCAPL